MQINSCSWLTQAHYSKTLKHERNFMFKFNCNATYITHYTRVSQTLPHSTKKKIPKNPHPWKRQQNKEAVVRARTVLQYCQLIDKNFCDIFKDFWHVHVILKIVFIYSIILSEIWWKTLHQRYNINCAGEATWQKMANN